MNRTQKSKDVLPKLPHNPEAEAAVLGAILLDNAYLAPASERLRPDDFMIPQNQRIFSAMLLMDRKGVPIDVISLSEELGDEGLSAAGGVAYISGLSDGLPKLTNIVHYTQIVKEKSGLRKIALAASVFQESALSGEALSTVLEKAETDIAQIREGAEATDNSPVSMKSLMSESYAAFERVSVGDRAIVGESTGYPELDELTAGWIAGDLVVIGARPSMGKSALAMEFFRRHSDRGLPCLFLSLEMSRVSVAMRLACMVARIDNQKLRTGHCDEEDTRKLRDATVRIANWPSYIADPPRMSASKIVRTVRHYGEQHGVKLVIVDYLQLVTARAENRTQEVSAVSRALKEAAKALGRISGGTVIALSQLARIKGNRPQLADLRESGSIEQDADLAMFLWNKTKDVKTGQADPHEKFLEIAKQRNGPTGTIPMMFLSPWASFEVSKPDLWENS